MTPGLPRMTAEAPGAMDEDRDLTVGQYRQILKTFAGMKRGQRPDAYMDFRDILYVVSDYFDNIDKEGYDHGKYIQYLFENKNIPEELLKLVPQIKY